MKKPRSVGPKNKANLKLGRNLANSLDPDSKLTSRNLCKISVPLFFLFWCGVVLFHANLTRGNEGDLLAYNGTKSDPGFRDKKLLNHTISVAKTEQENKTSRIMTDPNVSHITNSSTELNILSNQEHSIMVTSRLQELISVFFGHDPYTCPVTTQENGLEAEPETHQNGRIHLTYPNLDDFKHISRQEKPDTSRQLVNITHRLEPDGTPYNYASASKGAKVVAHNRESKGANNVLGKDHDKYLRNPCSAEGKFFIIELSDETLVDAVKIANFEHHSSNFKEFELSGSLVYPAETWDSLGSFVAANSKHMQCFKLPEPKWVRYLRVNLLSHYGSEFYCTLSVVEVYGVDAIEQMLEDLIVPSGEANTNSTAIPAVLSENSTSKSEIDETSRNFVETVSKGVVGSVDEGQMIGLDLPKKGSVTSGVSEPLPKARQHPNSRLHADAALKVVLQKVRSIELNMEVLEEYIKQLHKRRGDVLPELEKELTKFNALLEKSKSELKKLMEWKEIMAKGILELESWRLAVSTQMDLVVRHNSMLRVEVEKVLHDQVSLEKKELAILTVTLTFACIAIFKIISERVVKFFRAPTPGTVYQSSRGWILIFIFCSLTMLIPVIYD
ncbi:galactose-binding protein [Striga asiatica]|uniref:Galactose-binding protein n=1 Tax=Striga asiatica TaxID=4170 RepID=A0A5A7R8P6_STRAF|nr:galactose-binding protein [Striga asiatica]